jgi:hypothetical protein
MPGGGGSDAPGWTVLRDEHGAIRGVSDLAISQFCGMVDGETEWTAKRVVRPMTFELSLDPAEGRLDRWRDDPIWRMQATAGLTTTDEEFR